MKTLRKIPGLPRCSTNRTKWAHWYRFLYLSANQGDTSVFFSLVCIIMASQRALLVVYLVSLVYVRSAKCLAGKRRCWDGEVVGGSGTPRSAQPFLIFTVDWNLNSTPNTPLTPSPPAPISPSPTKGQVEPRKNNILFDWVFKIKKYTIIIITIKKETASLSADILFNQLHKKCTEKKDHIVQINVTSTLKEVMKQWGDIEQRCTITFSVMIWNWWKRLR